MDRLEKELDSIRIGDMKLHVNVPRYIKGQDSQRTPQSMCNARVKEPVTTKLKSRLVWKVKEGAKQVKQKIG